MRDFEAGLGHHGVGHAVLPLIEQDHQLFGLGVGHFEAGLELLHVDRIGLDLVAQVQLLVEVPQFSRGDIGDAGGKHVLRLLGGQFLPQRGQQGIHADDLAALDRIVHGRLRDFQKVPFFILTEAAEASQIGHHGPLVDTHTQLAPPLREQLDVDDGGLAAIHGQAE